MRATCLTDSALLDRLGLGDEVALDVLLDRHHAGLRALAASIVGRDLAGEVVQDVVVDLWERRASLRIQTSLRAYLLRATRNRALNAVRSRRRWGLRFGPLDAACNVPSPPRADDTGELSVAVARAVAALPERQRTAFRLRTDGDLSYAEIADVMGVSPRTVETHLARATRTVRASVPPELLGA